MQKTVALILIGLITACILVACSGVKRLINHNLNSSPTPTAFVYPTTTPRPSPTPIAINPWNIEVDTAYQCLTWESNQGRNLINIRTGETLDYEAFITDYIAPNPSSTPTSPFNPESDPTTPIMSPDGMYAIYRTDQQAIVEHIESGEVTIFDTESVFYYFHEAIWWSSDSQHFLYMDSDGDGLMLINADGTNPHPVAPVSYPLNVIGWSPDGHYFVFIGMEQRLEFWTIGVDNLPHLVRTKPSENTYRDFTWSHQGNQLAYFSFLAGSIYQVHLEGIEEGVSLEFFLQTEVDLSSIRFVWSPDDRYVALQYGDEWGTYYQHVNIYAMDGGEAIDALEMAYVADVDLPQVVHWIGESNQLLGWRTYPHILETYSIATGIRNVFAPALYAIPQIAPTGDRVALYVRDYEGNYVMDILLLTPDLTINNQERINVVNGASDMGWAYWSPTGAYLAVTWAAEEDESREVYLTWLQADGTGQHTLDADYADIRDLAWTQDGQELIYTASYGAGDVIEAVNLSTGETRLITDDYLSIQDLTYEPLADSLLFIWDDGTYEGIARYEVDGMLLDERRNTMVYNADGTISFWSPDYRVAAIKVNDEDTYGESLMLVSEDGAVTIVLREGLTGLGNPLWSPDGRLMAFTQSNDRQTTSLQIVTADGRQVWSMPNYYPVYSPLGWVACD